MRVKFFPKFLGLILFTIFLCQSALAGQKSTITEKYAAGGILKAPPPLPASKLGVKKNQVEVASNGVEEISTYDECSRVINSHSKGVFVPLNTRKEWSRFKQKPPQNVNLALCNEDEPDKPMDEEEVINKCGSGTKKERLVKVHFPNPNRTCAWKDNDNLKARDLYMQGRIEQEVGLDLPESSTLCGAEFDFKEQKFWYDDVFVMSLNNNIIASSYTWNGILEQNNGFYQYDWAKIQGKTWHIGVLDTQYCPLDVDKDGNPLPVSKTSCAFPGQDQKGTVKLAVSPEMMMKAMANSGQKNHKLKFVTIGDNDTSDCQHFDFEFNMKVSYVD